MSETVWSVEEAFALIYVLPFVAFYFIFRVKARFLFFRFVLLLNKVNISLNKMRVLKESQKQKYLLYHRPVLFEGLKGIESASSLFTT